ncbi:probable chitinase 10 isoform X2 [Condylostylus longicornis]|uniref:probable chitinase 10 isoform X2 n=1 Tax=Condylostylus longicornis TaxID=2530218 RepID=UPI00244E52E7|nr:probable chitinase 10 isoform X2 [Condylostylus longicornis]
MGKIPTPKLGFILIIFLYGIPVDAEEKKIVCYFNNSDVQTKNVLNLNLNIIDVNLCTHLIYSHAVLTEDDLFPLNKTIDIDNGGYLNFTKLKNQNPNLKTIISIQDSNEEKLQFSKILRSSHLHKSLAKNILNFIKQYNFDGIDIVWQNPGLKNEENERQCDKKNYEKFLRSLRREFTEDSRKRKLNADYLISIGVPYNTENVKHGYDIIKLNRYVDWFNLMSYDSKELFLLENNKTEIISPIKYYLNAGVTRDKIVLGISTYGLLFNVEEISENNFGQEGLLKNPFNIFQFGESTGILSYSEICKNIKNNPEWTLFRENFGSFTRSFAINQNKLIVFNDASTIRDKVESVVDRNLSGISFWTINQEDFDGSCINQSYPLINIAKKILLQKLNLRSSRSAEPQNVEDTATSNSLTRTGNEISRDRVVCYATSWSVYRTGPARFDLLQFDPNLCTHLIYAYAYVYNETIQFADENADITLGGYSKFLRLRSSNENLKLLLGIRVIEKQFSQVINDPGRRKKLIDNIVIHLKTHMFDGMDLIWKYPDVEDKQNFVQLLNEIRTRFIEENKTPGRIKPKFISITIPSETEFVDPGYDLPKLNDLVDWYNLLSYDYSTPNDTVVNHHAPLYPIDTLPDDKNNINSTVTKYLESGIDRTLLVVGIPTYGITFTLKDARETNYGAAAEGPGDPGKFTNISNSVYLSYFQICGLQLTSNWQLIRSYPGKVGPYIVNDKDWVAYDDEIMVKTKAEYVADMGLGGVMFWTVDQDDFRGICGTGPNILIQTAKTALLNKLNLGSLNTISTTTALIETQPVKATALPEGTAQIIITNNSLTSASISKDRAEENSFRNDRIVCYTTNWSVYRTGAARFLQNFIDPNLCTHIIYAYAKLGENNKLEPTDSHLDITFGGYDQLNNLKKLNSNLRTLIGIRFTDKNSLFASLLSERKSRQEFISSTLEFLKEYNFDGIDIVWKNLKLNERNSFVKFIEEISEKFNQESNTGFQQPLLLTIALPGKKEEMQGFDVARLNDYVDWFNVLTYNYHAATEPQVNHAAALYSLPEQPLDEFNVNFTMNEYLNAGAERNKLVLTIPTYGRTFTLRSTLQKNFGASSIGAGRMGMLTKTNGSLAYFEICDNLLKDPEWETYQPYADLVGPVVIKEDQWVSFDDENMMKIKADYVADNGFGGLAFWSIDQDDFRGICSSNPFTLIRAAKTRLDEKLGIAGETSIIRVTEPPTIRTTKSTSTTISTTTLGTTTQINSNLVLSNYQDNINVEGKINNRIVCYVTNWSYYRSGTARFIPNERNLDPNLCTHLNYYFAKIENNTVIPADEFVDINNDGYKMFTDLKNKNRNLKTLISISESPSNETLSKFSSLVSDPEQRLIFAENVLNFIKQYNFDGIDIVWLHPGDERGTADDKENFASLVEQLRLTFSEDILLAGRLPYIITVTVPFDEQIISTGYDIPKLNENVDWFNLLTYDYVLSSKPVVNHHSPLYAYEGISSANRNINSTVATYIELGVDRDKIVIGIPTYGRTFTLADSSMTNYGALASGFGIPGRFTQLNGSLAFYEICQNINAEGWFIVSNQSDLVGPYAYNDKNWVAYDDEDMVSRKAEYVALMGLGGMMFWTVDQDDFVGSCTGKANLLISTAKDALNERLGFGNLKPSTNNAMTPTSNIPITFEITTISSPGITDSNLNAPPTINNQIVDLTSESNNDLEEIRNRIVCYAPNWSRYRTGVAKFDASFILPDLCTHLIYAFANLVNNTVAPSDPADADQTFYLDFNKIKSKNPQVKTLISINQRPNTTESNYSNLVKDPERRQEFISNLIDFIKINNFDGVDIDWQFPGEASDDKENFAQFLKEIKSKFLEDSIEMNSQPLLLSITIPKDKRNLERGYDIAKMNDFVDWFNLVSYNYHISTESKVNHHAPLFALKGIDESENNVHF